MQPLQPIAPGGEHEDPLADAGQKASTYVSLAMALAQRRIDSRLGKAGSRSEPVDDALADAREKYRVMLGKDRGASSSSQDALIAWSAATPYRDTHRDARQASDRAEARLRTLHPDAMIRYDQLRTGVDRLEAMSLVAPLIDADGVRFAERSLDIHGQTRAAATGHADASHSTAFDSVALDAHAQILPGERPRTAAHNDIPSETASTGTDETATASTAPDAAPAPPTFDAEQAADRAAAAYAPRADGPPWFEHPAQRYAPVIRAALPAALATEVLTDPAFPRLADTLDEADRHGVNVSEILATAVSERELSSAKSAAQVLSYRLTHQQRGINDGASPTGTIEPDDPIDLASASSATTMTSCEPVARADDLLAPVAFDAAERGRTPTAADAVTASYPQPLRAIPVPPSSTSTVDHDAAVATLALGRADVAESLAVHAVPGDRSKLPAGDDSGAAGDADSVLHAAAADLYHAQSGSATAYPGTASFPQPLTARNLNPTAASAVSALTSTPAAAPTHVPVRAANAHRS